MKLSARRFPETITRIREMPGYRDSLGEWVAGAESREDLRASVQPLKTEDSDIEAGVQVRRRLKVFVLPRRERVGAARAVVLYSGDPLTLHGDPLSLFAGATITDRHALEAAIEAAGADRVVYDGAEYVVESSATWPGYTVATLLRET